MTTPMTEITTITLRAMWAKLDEAAAVARAAEALAADGQPGRALVTGLDVEPLACEANNLLQGLAILSRVARGDLRGSKWPTSSSFQDISVAELVQAVEVASIRHPPHTGLDTRDTMPTSSAGRRRPRHALSTWCCLGFVDPRGLRGRRRAERRWSGWGTARTRRQRALTATKRPTSSS
jgi:hypothetical protein